MVLSFLRQLNLRKEQKERCGALFCEWVKKMSKIQLNLAVAGVFIA
jgi:hypothetical protein